MRLRLPPDEIQITVPRHRCIDFDVCYHLTERDLEILTHFANGLSNKQVAWKCRISAQSLKNHMAMIRNRMNLVGGTMTTVIVTAHRLRIITIPQYRRPPPVIVTSKRGV